MLRNLHVKNLALIDEAEVDFEKGLNILTGETGAGKSIIIGSINLALGEKVSKEMLRDNEENAFVELIFDVESDALQKDFRRKKLRQNQWGKCSGIKDESSFCVADRYSWTA